MNLSVVGVENLLKYKSHFKHTCIAKNTYLVYCIDMNKFEFKNLINSLEKSLREKSLFRFMRKEVETGANGTQDYVVKKGINKDTIAKTRQ